MFKVLYALQPTVSFLLRSQSYFFRKNPLNSKTRRANMQKWSKDTLDRMKVKLQIRGKVSKKPCLLIGNHSSYLDIPVICSQVPAVFLAKAEIEKWPFLGSAARLAGTVFVNRQSEESRKASVQKAVRKFTEDKEHLVIFPSGTTSVDESVPWRLGAFKMAMEHGIPVQAFRLRYEPESSAFIGDDALLPHMNQLLKNPEIKASIEFKRPKTIKDPLQDMEALKAWCLANTSSQKQEALQK